MPATQVEKGLKKSNYWPRERKTGKAGKINGHRQERQTGKADGRSFLWRTSPQKGNLLDKAMLVVGGATHFFRQLAGRKPSFRLHFPSVAKIMLLGLKNYTCGYYADGYKVERSKGRW